METIGSKRSYALLWCMPNNDDDNDSVYVSDQRAQVMSREYCTDRQTVLHSFVPTRHRHRHWIKIVLTSTARRDSPTVPTNSFETESSVDPLLTSPMTYRFKIKQSLR